MSKTRLVLGAIIFLIVLTSLSVGHLPAQAFNKKGPAHIPGELFPHLGIPVDKHLLKHNGMLLNLNTAK